MHKTLKLPFLQYEFAALILTQNAYTFTECPFKPETGIKKNDNHDIALLKYATKSAS